jgi:hypothetical protein
LAVSCPIIPQRAEALSIVRVCDVELSDRNLDGGVGIGGFDDPNMLRTIAANAGDFPTQLSSWHAGNIGGLKII